VLLSFGEYWGKNARLPFKVESVGYPYLNAMVDFLKDKGNPAENQLLIISQPTVATQMIDLCEHLSITFPNYHILYKLHPIEFPMRHRYESLSKFSNVELIEQANIYELIASCSIIIGYNSLVLTEALAFPLKRIFIWQNPDLPFGAATMFENQNHLVELIRNPQHSKLETIPHQLWEQDWHTKMDAFVKQIIPEYSPKAVPVK
jgi:hypothetical protein